MRGRGSVLSRPAQAIVAGAIIVGLIAAAFLSLRDGPDTGAPAAEGTLLGIATDTSGAAIVGAEVRAGGSLIGRTTWDGHFTAPLLPGNYTVSVRADGYVPAHEPVHVEGGRTHLLYVMMVAAPPAKLLEASAGGTVPDEDARLLVPPDSLVYFDTQEPAGKAVEVRFEYFNTTRGANLDVFPGLFRGRDSSGDLVPIETFGFAYVEATKGGREVQPKPGSTARIEFPVPPGFDPARERIPKLWSLDEASGEWAMEGDLTVDCSRGPCVFVADVGHFSSWNCDRENEVVTTRGKALLTKISRPTLVDWVLKTVAPQIAAAISMIEWAIELAVDLSEGGDLTLERVAETFFRKVVRDLLDNLGLEAIGQDLLDQIFRGVNEVEAARGLLEGLGAEFADEVAQAYAEGEMDPAEITAMLARGLQDAWDAYLDATGVAAQPSVNPSRASDAASAMADNVMTEIETYVTTDPGQPMDPQQQAALEEALSEHFFGLTIDSQWEADYGVLITNTTAELLELLERIVNAFLFGEPPQEEEGRIRAASVHDGPRGIFERAQGGMIRTEGTALFGDEPTPNYIQDDAILSDGTFRLMAQKAARIQFQAWAPGYTMPPRDVFTPDRNVRPSDPEDTFFNLAPLVLFRPAHGVMVLIDESTSMGYPYAVPSEFAGGKELLEALRTYRGGGLQDLEEGGRVWDEVVRLKTYLYDRQIPRTDYIRIDAAKAVVYNLLAVLDAGGYDMGIVEVGGEPILLEPPGRDFTRLADRIYFLDNVRGEPLLGASLTAALDALASGTILLITDGSAADREEILDQSRADNPIRRAREQGVRICVGLIGLAGSVDNELYRTIAKVTGCPVTFGKDVRGLSAGLARHLLEEKWENPVVEVVDAKAGGGSLRFEVTPDADRLAVYGFAHWIQLEDLVVKDPNGREPPGTTVRTLQRGVGVDHPTPGTWQAKTIGDERYTLVVAAHNKVVFQI